MPTEFVVEANDGSRTTVSLEQQRSGDDDGLVYYLDAGPTLGRIRGNPEDFDQAIFFVINGPTLGRERVALGRPPENVDVPALLVNGALSLTAVVGDTLECTDGNWTGEPSDFAYQWKRNGTVNIGGDDPEYVVVAADAGDSISCVVTASNDAGSTAAPPSNTVEIDAPVTRRK